MLLDQIDSINWIEFIQPPWNKPNSVAEALRLLSEVTNEQSSIQANTRVLFAIGNDHGGTFYPVAIPAISIICMIATEGDEWARYTAFDILIQLLSFDPDLWPNTPVDFGSQASALTAVLVSEIKQIRPRAEQIITTEVISERLYSIIQEFLESLDEL